MKPLNYQTRSSARRKFSGLLLSSVLLIALAIYLVLQVPPTYSPTKKPDWMSAFKSKVDSVVIAQQHINLLFVIDATDGMGEYYPAIGEAIRSFSAAADSSKTYRYAAVIYRDAEEGEFLLQHTGRRNSAEEVANYVDRTMALKNTDKDEPEAVFFGLREALKSDHLKKGETNAVILIGDAGNHAQTPNTEVPPEDIVNLLADNPSHFFVIQVRHPDQPSTYDEFIPQLKDEIITPVVQKRLAEVSEYEGGSNSTWESAVGESGTQFTLNQGNSLMNDLFELEKGATMAPEELTLRLQEIFEKVVNETDKRVGDLEMLKTAEVLDPSLMNASSVISVLKNSHVPAEQLNYLTKPKLIQENEANGQ